MASAHYVYEQGVYWQEGDHCGKLRNEISHGIYDQGYFRGDSYGRQKISGLGLEVNCAPMVLWQRPPEYYAVRVKAVKQGPDGNWGLCKDYNWKKLAVEASGVTWDVHWENRPLCGAGTYANLGGGALRHPSTHAWVPLASSPDKPPGGWWMSGKHDLPVSLASPDPLAQ